MICFPFVKNFVHWVGKTIPSNCILKSMKKTFIQILILFLCAVPALLFSACHGEHNYGDWIIDSAATCTESGVKIRFCECGQEQIESIPQLGHNTAQRVVETPPTCVASGIENQICRTCGMILSVEQIPPKGHTSSDWITVAEPTCLATGTKHRVCAECGVTLEFASIALSDHTEGVWIVDEKPSSTKEGRHHQICAVCRITLKTEVLPVVPVCYIILDAGHGGYDHGAIVEDVHEKDINLQVTYTLKALLEARGAAVVLTREEDSYLALSERTDFANQVDADLFVSIHCNYFEESKAITGFEAYYYQNSKAEFVANRILRELKNAGSFPVRNVKSGELYVLMNTRMPAILLELGFLTNEQECKNLCDKAYQTALAEIIADSIVAAISQMK